jgi:hypothetical protein
MSKYIDLIKEKIKLIDTELIEAIIKEFDDNCKKEEENLLDLLKIEVSARKNKETKNGSKNKM